MKTSARFSAAELAPPDIDLELVTASITQIVPGAHTRPVGADLTHVIEGLLVGIGEFAEVDVGGENGMAGIGEAVGEAFDRGGQPPNRNGGVRRRDRDRSRSG